VRKLLALVLVPALLTLACCSRKPAPAAQGLAGGPPGAAAARAQNGAGPAAGTAAVSPGGETAAKPIRTAPAVAAPAGPVAARPLEAPPAWQLAEEQQLLHLKGSSVMPEDFVIGPLANILGSEGEEGRVLAVASRFFERMTLGEVLTEALLPEVREELTSSFAYYLERGLVPRSVRLGEVSIAAGPSPESAGREAWLRVRLFGDPGVTEGELYLQEAGGTWYVADLQVGFELLARTYERPKEKYLPTDYGWQIR
jgi:hypothetical protein